MGKQHEEGRKQQKGTFVQLFVQQSRFERMEQARELVEAANRTDYLLEADETYQTLIHLAQEKCKLYGERPNGERVELVLPKLYRLCCAARDTKGATP